MISQLKYFLKERLYERLNIPYSKAGIPIALLKYLKKSQPISLVDVGAHNGDFTTAIAKYCEIYRALLIEPIHHKANQLREKFCDPKYKVFECALSCKLGEIDLEINEAEATSSILRIRREMPELADVNLGIPKTVVCQTRTLDDVALQANIDAIDLLKIDVQGAEHLVISGADEVLKATSMVWTEVSFKALYEGSSTFTEIYSLLTQAGFKFIELEPGFRSPDGELLQGDALFMKR